MPKASAEHLPHYTAHIVAGRDSGPNPGQKDMHSTPPARGAAGIGRSLDAVSG
jgi:hypothetical protein